MGLSEDGEDAVEKRFEELCLDLNMDKHAKEDAWQNYQKIRTNYTLEGNQIHWLACALYEACRRTVVPTVGKGTVEGNCVSLTRLLRSAKFSLIQFFNKMKKWSDMSNLPQEFRDKVNKLERNFAVSTVIFKKFEPIFLDLFRSPLDEPPRQNRSRKQRRLPCSITDVFNFCWTMFVQVKGHFPAISDDLVNSYHLLLCNLDWFYANALLGSRKDLINPEFSGLPENYHSKDWKPPVNPPCIIKLLCEKHEGLEIEAKVIKEHWWKPHIRKLFDKKYTLVNGYALDTAKTYRVLFLNAPVNDKMAILTTSAGILKGKPDTFSAILEIGNFEANRIAINKAYEETHKKIRSKAINSEYEEYVLSVGDFDERIFLGDDAEEEIGTPAKSREAASGELSEQMQAKTSLQQHFDETRSLAPSTPLTGRRYLKEKDPSITPVSTATQSVSRLQNLLSGRKTCPTDSMLDIFSTCTRNPKDTIIERVKEMGETFCTNYVQPTDTHPGAHKDFAKKRLQLGESLYYKVLESVLITEKKRHNKDAKIDLTGLLEHDMFHRCLFACCLEVIIFSYNSQRIFPWIVDIFDIGSYHFYKVVEIIIRAEEGLSRDVVKHLNHIEESILESLAWKSESPLWDAIKEQVPACEEVILPSQIESNLGSSSVPNSPMMHPAVKRLVVEGRSGTQKVTDPLQSPPGPSAADRFSSPSPGSAKRRLFGGIEAAESKSSSDRLATSTTETVSISTPSSVTAPKIIAFQQALTEDGRHVLIPVQTLVNSSGQPLVPPVLQTETAPAPPNKPKKTGSLALFFRKVYHLASVRLKDLCDRLDIPDDQRRKMWTCFEHALVHHADMMQDRHLDQMIMCAIYVMAKVTDNSQSFQNIMRCYRLQPQAQSHVYRSVLLNNRRRHTSGSSDGSRNGASCSSSPVNVAEKEEAQNKGKRRTEVLSTIRSTSTLPIPHPSSHPPTPTCLMTSGPGMEMDDERGDLIKFYNKVYVSRMKKFAQKFSNQTSLKDCPPLSPLPVVRSQISSPRRVSSLHSVYISPHKTEFKPLTPTGGMHYCFQRSPAKDLRAINNMIKMGEKKTSFLGKRVLDVDCDEEDEDGSSPAKQQFQGHSFMRRLQNVTIERQEANSAI